MAACFCLCAVVGGGCCPYFLEIKCHFFISLFVFIGLENVTRGAMAESNASASLLSARKCQRTFFCCASLATPHPTKQTCRPPIHLTFVYPFFRLVFPAFLNGNSQRRSCLCATVPFALVQKHKKRAP